MKTLMERIAFAVQHTKQSPQRVALRAGISPSAMSQLLRGQSKKLRAETAVRLEAATGLSTHWLVTGEGEPFAVSDMEGLRNTWDLQEGQGVRVPLLANGASMGDGEALHQDDVVQGHLTLTPQFVSERIRPTKKEALRFIHAHGDSMEPTFHSGDILLVDTGIQNITIDGVYVLRAHERLFVKRVRQRIDGLFEVSSDNPAHKTVDVLSGDQKVEVLGRVLWSWAGHRI